MNKPKVGRIWGKDIPVEDPGLLRTAFRVLRDAEVEFPIKVEGTSTLPYFSVVKVLDFEGGAFQLKLVRPLPHELLKGAEFRMTFALEDQRYEALIQFKGREAYLTYLFSLPAVLFHADRRQHKRFPFRPRESAYVTAQDGGIPGLGVAGALVNIGEGGFAIRVDRVIRLEDGMRIPPTTAVFDRGKHFARIRLQDLPRLPILEISGLVSHTHERGSEILVGFTFARLSDMQSTAIRDCLSFREKVLGASTAGVRNGFTPRARPASSTPSPGKGEAPPAPVSKAEPERPVAHVSLSEPLHVLARRTSRLVLAVADTETRARLLGHLRRNGYHRITVVPDLAQAGAHWKQPQAKPVLLLVDLGLAVDQPDPVAAARGLERQVATYGEIPMVLFCPQVDPSMMLGLAHRTRVLSSDPADPNALEEWLATLDSMAGLGDR